MIYRYLQMIHDNCVYLLKIFKHIKQNADFPLNNGRVLKFKGTLRVFPGYGSSPFHFIQGTRPLDHKYWPWRERSLATVADGTGRIRCWGVRGEKKTPNWVAVYLQISAADRSRQYFHAFEGNTIIKVQPQTKPNNPHKPPVNHCIPA